MSVVTCDREPNARHGARLGRFALAASLSLSLSLWGCGQERVAPRVVSPAPTAGSPSLTAESIEAARQLSLELEMLKNLRFVGMDDGPVPDFQLRAAGAEYRSDELVGQRAFVVVFFATWCEACGYKLESMQRALARTGPVSIIPVAVDGPETWPAVGPYLEQYGISAPAVRAADYPFFAFSYNPFETVPLVVIVGRNGGLADYQLGFDSEQESRLQDSLRLAKTIGPLANPRL
jgi:hypothetical protein